MITAYHRPLNNNQMDRSRSGSGSDANRKYKHCWALLMTIALFLIMLAIGFYFLYLEFTLNNTYTRTAQKKRISPKLAAKWNEKFIKNPEKLWAESFLGNSNWETFARQIEASLRKRNGTKPASLLISDSNDRNKRSLKSAPLDGNTSSSSSMVNNKPVEDQNKSDLVSIFTKHSVLAVIFDISTKPKKFAKYLLINNGIIRLTLCKFVCHSILECGLRNSYPVGLHLNFHKKVALTLFVSDIDNFCPGNKTIIRNLNSGLFRSFVFPFAQYRIRFIYSRNETMYDEAKMLSMLNPEDPEEEDREEETERAEEEEAAELDHNDIDEDDSDDVDKNDDNVMSHLIDQLAAEEEEEDGEDGESFNNGEDNEADQQILDKLRNDPTTLFHYELDQRQVVNDGQIQPGQSEVMSSPTVVLTVPKEPKKPKNDNNNNDDLSWTYLLIVIVVSVGFLFLVAHLLVVLATGSPCKFIWRWCNRICHTLFRCRSSPDNLRHPRLPTELPSLGTAPSTLSSEFVTVPSSSSSLPIVSVNRQSKTNNKNGTLNLNRSNFRLQKAKFPRVQFSTPFTNQNQNKYRNSRFCSYHSIPFDLERTISEQSDTTTNQNNNSETGKFIPKPMYRMNQKPSFLGRVNQRLFRNRYDIIV